MINCRAVVTLLRLLRVWAEKWRILGLRPDADKTLKVFWNLPLLPENFQTTAEVLLNKVPNPQMPTEGAVNWQLIQECTLPLSICVQFRNPEQEKVVKKTRINFRTV